MFGRQDKNNAQPDDNFESDNFTDIDSSIPLPDHPDVPPDLAFLPPSGINSVMGTMSDSGLSSLSNRQDLIGSIARETLRAGKLYGRLSSGDLTAIGETAAFAADMATQVKAASSKAGTPPSIQVDTTMRPPTGGNFDNGNGGGVGFSSAHHLSLTPDPTPIRFSTDIKQIFYTPNYSCAVSFYSHTCFATGVTFQLPTTGNDLASFNTVSVMNDLRNQISRNINFPLSQTSTFTNANLLLYFNNLILALSQYYAAKRFLVWGQTAPSKIDGLYNLANSFTPTDIAAYGRLERMLAGIPIPPKLNEFLFWVHQLYSSGDLTNDPVIFIDPIGMTAGVPTWTTDFTNSLSTLNTTAMLDIANGLARAFPNWEKSTLYTGNANLDFDKGFLTLWRNLPFRCSGSATVVHDVTGPYVLNTDSLVYYNSWDSDLDGCIPGFVAASTVATGVGTWLPSLVTPKVVSTLTSGNSTNRYHFGRVSGVSGWYDSYNDDVALLARDETYSVNTRFTNLSNVTLVSGSQQLAFVTCTAALQTAEAIVDFWLSWDTMNVRVDKSLGNTSPGRVNSYNRRRNRKNS